MDPRLLLPTEGEYVPKKDERAYDNWLDTTRYVVGLGKRDFAVEGVRKVQDMREGPGIVLGLPHHLNRNIPDTSYALMDALGRQAYYLAAAYLPQWLEKLGAIHIYRDKDIELLKHPENIHLGHRIMRPRVTGSALSDEPPGGPLTEREAKHLYVKRANYVFGTIIPELYRQGELIVIYPNVERGQEEIQQGVLRNIMKKTLPALEGDPEFSGELSFIPLDMDYEYVEDPAREDPESKWNPKRVRNSPVIHTFGEPFTAADLADLEAKVHDVFPKAA